MFQQLKMGQKVFRFLGLFFEKSSKPPQLWLQSKKLKTKQLKFLGSRAKGPSKCLILHPQNQSIGPLKLKIWQEKNQKQLLPPAHKRQLGQNPKNGKQT